MKPEELEEKISRLASAIQSVRGTPRPDWGPVWEDIRSIGSAFGSVRPADSGVQQKAWGRFQNLVDEVRELAKQDKEKRRVFAEGSARHLHHIRSLADAAEPPGALAELIFIAVTGGASLLIGAALDPLMGKQDEVSADIRRRGELLREAGQYLGRNKSEMRGEDKAAAFEAIKARRERLDSERASWKVAIGDAKVTRHKEYLERQSRRDEWQRKHEEWRRRQIEFVSRMESSVDRLMEIREKRRMHLRDLEQKLSDAWSESYRSRISDWIRQEEANIGEIEQKISSAADRLAEARSKLS